MAIPPEAPELSAELGKRISAIEGANITLLNRYFDQKRNEVDRFIDKEWVPTFASEFFSSPQISQAWNTIVEEKDKAQRLMFIIKLGPKLQEKINDKRRELIQPLNELERIIEASLRAEYSQVKAINNSVTSFLLSASDVATNRNRLLNLAGVPESSLSNIIDDTDNAVSDLLSKTKNSREKVNSVHKFIRKIQKLKKRYYKGS